ncbi:MAG: dihydrofolate reductase family protein [Anaerolineae bacterium]|nr:dihydrofolate reductase family protein [Anaerolineae bacterium]
MRKIIYSMMVSLDGFVARANGDLDWVIVDEELHSFANEQQREIGTSLYGRGLYEVMRYWETADQNPESTPLELQFAVIWQATPKIVFSATLDQVSGNTRLVREDAVAEIRRLKQQPGKMMDVGGPTLAAALMQQNLIDEFGLYVHPVVLGSGIPFFPPLETPLNLQLVEKRPFQSGVFYLRYKTNQ